MSGQMHDGPMDEGAADDPDLLAAEYVLGMLPGPDAARCALLRRTDPAFARQVDAWERRLMPLAALVPPVPPPAGLRERIEAAMQPVLPEAPAVARPAAPAGLRRQLWLWRGLTGASMAVACGLAVLLWARPTPPATTLAVLLPPGDATGGFVVQAMNGAVRLEPVRPPAVPAGRDLQLWSLPAGATVPRSLGVLPGAGEVLPGSALPAGDLQLLVSLEPSGGSPSGLPTGPVVLAAALHR